MSLIPPYEELQLLYTHEEKNPNRRESIWLGCIAGPANWPWLFLYTLIVPLLDLLWKAVVIVTRFFFATLFVFLLFPFLGIIGRVKRGKLGPPPAKGGA
jgi:hypothetical protein